MTDSVRECEREVEEARSKLAQDLATLREPATLDSFTHNLKDTAFDAKDALIDQAKETVQNKMSGLVEELKAKAAANPAAAISIGAGLAWHFFRNPPIASALIGVGLYSLWRTSGGFVSDDYLQYGRTRLKEQAVAAGASAANMAAEAGAAVVEKASELAESAKSSMQDLADSAVDQVADTGAAVKSKIESATGAVRRTAHDVRDEIENVADTVRGMSQRASDAAAETGQNVLNLARVAPSRVSGMAAEALESAQVSNISKDTRDTVLLGVAGLAVAAALGVAYQKRTLEEVE